MSPGRVISVSPSCSFVICLSLATEVDRWGPRRGTSHFELRAPPAPASVGPTVAPWGSYRSLTAAPTWVLSNSQREGGGGGRQRHWASISSEGTDYGCNQSRDVVTSAYVTVPKIATVLAPMPERPFPEQGERPWDSRSNAKERAPRRSPRSLLPSPCDHTRRPRLRRKLHLSSLLAKASSSRISLRSVCSDVAVGAENTTYCCDARVRRRGLRWESYCVGLRAPSG